MESETPAEFTKVKSRKAQRLGQTSTCAVSSPQETCLVQGDGTVIRVLCVDDHAVLVEGLRAQFAIEGRIQVAGRLASTDRLLEEVERLRPDVVILDGLTEKKWTRVLCRVTT